MSKNLSISAIGAAAVLLVAVNAVTENTTLMIDADSDFFRCMDSTAR